MNVIKRDGSEEAFDIQKIIQAIQKANEECNELSPEKIIEISNKIWKICSSRKRALDADEVQDIVERVLVDQKAPGLVRSYLKYKMMKESAHQQNTTDSQMIAVVEGKSEEINQENSNKNPILIPTQRDYIAGIASRDITNRYLLPEDIKKLHKLGIIHFHDSDYFIEKIHNCDLLNIEDMLMNGTVINGTMIETPHTFTTACTIVTQIMAQAASNQYGGQTVTLSHLVPFVEFTRQRIKEDLRKDIGDSLSEGKVNEIVERRVRKEIESGVEILQYQINTLMTTNGQAPFVSICMYLNEVETEKEKEDLAIIIEEVLKQRIKGVKNEAGQWVSPAFPKLLYVLEEDNIRDDSKYMYLTKLAIKCSAYRMVPDYISEKKMLEYKYPKENLLTISQRRDQWGDEGTWGKNPFKTLTDEECNILQEYVDSRVKTEEVEELINRYNLKKKDLIPLAYPCMGCRSFLTPDYIHYKYYGRFNCGVVTINLIDIACSSKKSIERFWKIFDERLEACHKALKIRHKRLKGTPSDVAPILWQHGALGRLDKGESIDKLLYNNYCTISLGYAGLWECVYYMTGKKLTEPEGEELGLQIMQSLNDYTSKWREQENISYSVYGTPIESTTYKFAKCLQDRFGIIPGVTDRSYVTNSYHIHVTEKVDAFTKLETESKFQKLSPGGAISYIESPDMSQNLDALLDIVKFMYETIMYSEINARLDSCSKCNYEGEIPIVFDENNKPIWECPNCRNRDTRYLTIRRRVCGYIGTNAANDGRMNEYADRVIHLS